VFQACLCDIFHIETSGTDTILFGEGNHEEDIRVPRDNKNLYLTNLKRGNHITIQDFFYNESRQIEKVEFAEGSRWDMDVIEDKVESVRLSDGSELDVETEIWKNPINGIAPPQSIDTNASDVALKLNLYTQAMASFEDTTGMMWEEAVEKMNRQMT